MAQSKTCCSCKGELLDFHDPEFCDCSFNFCRYCYNEHRNGIANIYPNISKEQRKCLEHNEMYTRFCHQENCRQVICHVCAKRNHYGHNICDLSVRHQEIVEKMSVHKEKYTDELEEATNLIFKIKNLKASFKEDVKGLKTFIRKNYNALIELARVSFERQMEKLNQISDNELEHFSVMLEILERYRGDISRICQLNYHLATDAPYFNVNSHYKKYEKVKNDLNLEKIPTSFTATKLTINSNISKYSELEKHIEEFIGEASILQSERIYSNSSQEAALISNFYEFENEKIIDACYDDYIGCLYLLLSRSKSHFIKMMRQTFENFEFKIKVKPDARCLSIMLLERCTILLLYENRLKLIYLDLRRLYFHLPMEIEELNNVLAICSSPCKNFAYVLCSDGCIFKYNPSSNKCERKVIELTHGVAFMNIDESLEYIVLSTVGAGPITVYSFNTGRKSYELGNSQHLYTSTLFLPGNVLVAFRNYNSCSLDIFHFPENEESRNIPSIKHVQKLRPVCAMVMCQPGMIYICEKNRVYLISL